MRQDRRSSRNGNPHAPASPALLPIASILSSCTSTDYDLVKTASIQPRFHDTDPQDFGGSTPHHHSVHGIDVSKWNGDIDWRKVKNSGVSFAFIKATEGKDRWTRASTNIGSRRAPSASPTRPIISIISAPQPTPRRLVHCQRAEERRPPPARLDVEWNGESKTCRYRPARDTVRSEMKRFMDRLEAH